MSQPKKIKTPDVLVIGAGPAGSTFAMVLAKAGLKVLMIDAGPQLSNRPGRVLKNTFAYQRNLNQFTNIIQGLLHPLSVPPGEGQLSYEIDPISWRPRGESYTSWKYSDRGAINPCQDPAKNLGGEAVAFSVGGMMQHWTAATPRHHPKLEMYRFSWLNEADNRKRWNELYKAGEELLGTNNTTFERSIRNTIVREALRDYYALLPADKQLPADYGVQNLPMAVRRSANPKNNEFVFYTGTDKILEPVIDDPAYADNLEILPETRVKRLVHRGDSDEIEYAEVEDLMEGDSYRLDARVFVVASGAVMSAYILWNSRIATNVVGRYIIEHPIAFTQIILKQSIIDQISRSPAFQERLEMQRERTLRAQESYAEIMPDRRPPAAVDLLPIPMDDPTPNVWIPVSENRPWHCQIHKDAFHYGVLPAGVDDRLIVDLRWFAILEPRESNRVVFERDRFTAFGTAQPTFHFTLSTEERCRMHTMMDDMVGAAGALGAFLPGSEPKFMPKGLALHIQGTTRMGADPENSVVDEDLKVHGMKNLYVGGNGVIPTANAANPTLTNVSLALHAADVIAKSLGR